MSKNPSGHRARPDVVPSALDELRHAMYHPDRSGTPDVRLRHARKVLGRPGLRHGELDSLSEPDARTLLASIDRTFGFRPRGRLRRTIRTRMNPS